MTKAGMLAFFSFFFLKVKVSEKRQSGDAGASVSLTHATASEEVEKKPSGLHQAM